MTAATGEASLLQDQQEANERLVLATLEAMEQAQEASDRALALIQSERDLRDAGAFREQFLGIVGHDLRQPLSSMMMAAHLLQERGNVRAEDVWLIDRMLQSGERMDRLIQQLMAFTRARLGSGLPIEKRPTDLREVCRQIIEEFQPQTALRIHCEFIGDLRGSWDADRLLEVFSNILVNSMQYAAKDTAIVLRGKDAAAEVLIEITNQGETIPADVLKVLFVPFSRGKPKEKSKPGILGLGLFISQEIARAHGGTLEVSSTQGTTTFTMHLPRA